MTENKQSTSDLHGERKAGVGSLILAKQSMYSLKELDIPNEEIYESLLEKGLSDSQATQMISSLESYAKDDYESALAEMIRGGLILFGALLITVLTIRASKGEGVFVVMLGAILIGASDFFIGLSRLVKYRRILRKIKLEKQESES